MTTVTAHRRPHPIDDIRRKAYSAQTEPVRDAVQECIGRYQLVAIVEEDVATLAAMAHVNGLVAFICTLVNADGKVIAQGRGNAVLNANNKFIQRTVGCAFNSSLTDAAIRATKVLDLLRVMADGVEEEYVVREADNSKPATDKQRAYLYQLVQANVHDEDGRSHWEDRIGELTKSEASAAIAEFKQ